MIDLVSILPWDRETVLNSVKKTGRCIVSHEAPYTGGFGAEIAASIQVKKSDAGQDIIVEKTLSLIHGSSMVYTVYVCKKLSLNCSQKYF